MFELDGANFSILTKLTEFTGEMEPTTVAFAAGAAASMAVSVAGCACLSLYNMYRESGAISRTSIQGMEDQLRQLQEQVPAKTASSKLEK